MSNSSRALTKYSLHRHLRHLGANNSYYRLTTSLQAGHTNNTISTASTSHSSNTAIRQLASSSTSAFFSNVSVTESIRESVKTTFLNEASKHDSRLWRNDKNQVNGSLDDGGVNQPLSTSLLDPLEDLYQTASSRYFPGLPPLMNGTSNNNNNNSDNNADPFALAKAELDSLSASIREDLIGTSHPVLNQAASYFFDKTADSGKKIRPMMVLLISRALANSTNTASADHKGGTSALFTSPLEWQRPDLPQAQRRLAEISEMIHTASLFRKSIPRAPFGRLANLSRHLNVSSHLHSSLHSSLLNHHFSIRRRRH
jgi:hypothetical protein